MAIEPFSVNQVVALARDASMSSSYKPALLKALVRIVRRGSEQRITLHTIGAEFVSMFWVQTVVFRLRQAATLNLEPEVVTRIRCMSDEKRARRLADLTTESRERLNLEMAKVIQINVLDAFHRSKPLSMERLYDWSRPEQFITMTDSARFFVQKNGSTLEAIANLWWARYLERVNRLAPLVIQKVEREGATRGSLKRYLQILTQIDGPSCFYCGRSFGAKLAAVHVDHVIPWSFLLEDPLWDLVLSCAGCNLSKSDTLPDPRFLEQLVKINLKRSRAHLPQNLSPLLGESEIFRYYDAALSVEWPKDWLPQNLVRQKSSKLTSQP